MWKSFDNGARNMGVEYSPYHPHHAEAENFCHPLPPQYLNGNVSEQAISDRNSRRPVIHYYQTFKSPETYNNYPRSQNPSFIEHTPYKQRQPSEAWTTRKRLKLDSERPDEQQQSNKLINEKLVDSSSESKTANLCDTQLAPFLNIQIDNETFDNLKKILQSSETSAIETNKPPDLQNHSDEKETNRSRVLQSELGENEDEELHDSQKQSSGKETKKLVDLQKQSSENETKLSPVLNIPFHNVHLDTVIWENLKKITVSPVCLKASDSITESTTNQDDSLVSQSTKSEILTESSLSQGDLSLLTDQTPNTSKAACSSIVEDERKLSDDPWFLNEKDSLNHASNKTPGSVNRVRKSSLTCHSCGERGHSARFCTKVKKLPVCFICAREGHTGEFCRDVICSRCLHPGHPADRCRWFDRENSLCSLCKFPGHYTPECPDLWRRYHLTSTPGHVVCPPRHMVTDRIFCYNCAEEGHLGHDCEEERIDAYSFPYYPFIVDYSIPHI